LSFSNVRNEPYRPGGVRPQRYTTASPVSFLSGVDLHTIIMVCAAVKITESGICQVEGDKVVATVPKEEIRRVRLSHDSQSRHPFLRFFTGFALVTTGLILLIAAFIIAEGGVYLLQMQSYTLRIPISPIVLWLMVGVGLWLLVGVFRGRYNLLLDTEKGTRKIFFTASADIREIRCFIERANGELGYDIDTSIMETMYIKPVPDNNKKSV